MRRVAWVQILIGWLPVWALLAVMVFTAHGGLFSVAALVSLRLVIAGAVIGLLVFRLTMRLPWPRPLRVSFVAIHCVAAAAYSVSWFALNSVIQSLVRGETVIVIGYGLGPYFVLGVWLYVMIAGVSYSAQSADRAALAEAAAARAQLAALRSQLNPHFLFNALHTVVQLIPREPKRAAHVAEELAGLLRETIEEDRDVVTLDRELAFVEKYLSLERVRFGERLRVRVNVAESARSATVPSFAVQTLVENAVRHGAAPRVEPTDISVDAGGSGGVLVVTVRDTGGGASPATNGSGTGLKRLRERLGVLYGGTARLDAGPAAGGFVATLTIPQEAGD